MRDSVISWWLLSISILYFCPETFQLQSFHLIGFVFLKNFNNILRVFILLHLRCLNNFFKMWKIVPRFEMTKFTFDWKVDFKKSESLVCFSSAFHQFFYENFRILNESWYGLSFDTLDQKLHSPQIFSSSEKQLSYLQIFNIIKSFQLSLS